MVKALTRIHLVRHGEVHNPRQILYGRLPRFRLSEQGLLQARSTARWLNRHPIAALFSSPMLRARQTAQAFADINPSLKRQISSWLNEVHTAFEGRPGAEIDARGGDVYSGCDGCFEQPEDIVARVKKFTVRMRARFAGRQVVAVTHGDIVTFTVLWSLGHDLSPRNKTRLKQVGFPVAYPAHASITTLTFQSMDSEERPAIQYRNPSQT